jgi:hypothetical protein
MEQRGLRVLEADKTFFTKITNTISKLLIPTKVGINGILISMKRNNLLKAHEAYLASKDSDDIDKKEQDMRKYEETYSLYLESIDKYIMDSVYKKVKANTASSFEKEALSKYYTIIHLKENEYTEYKHRKQKYLLELDYETVSSLEKEKLIQRYKPFYIAKMDSLYKGILKNYSIQLADTSAAKFRSNDDIYEKIFQTLEEYIGKILPIKLEQDVDGTYKQVLTDYDKFERFSVGKLDEKDIVEKKMVLLGISRNLFTHSIPLIIAEQCYIKLLKDTRKLIVNANNDNKRKQAYKLWMIIIEDYNIKLLSTKVYWDRPELREEYKEFWDKYKKIAESQKTEEEKNRLKEILFLKYDIKKLRTSKKDQSEIIAFHKARLLEYEAIRTVVNKASKLEGRYVKKI